jgi:hypothetical protein
MGKSNAGEGEPWKRLGRIILCRFDGLMEVDISWMVPSTKSRSQTIGMFLKGMWPPTA